ncbi:MAG: hypothetical protein MOB07_25970 [Acidobacteria bacterium]|nr:hypothetical protein [Acidobacteriota bacterium]
MAAAIEDANRTRPIKHLRWHIGGALFLSTVINYIDRQTLSVLAPYIKTEYQWTNTDFAMLIIAFRVVYAALSTMVLNLPADIYPTGSVASVSGMSGTGAGIGTITATYLTGVVADRYSFEPILIAASLIPLLAVAAAVALVRNNWATESGIVDPNSSGANPKTFKTVVRNPKIHETELHNLRRVCGRHRRRRRSRCDATRAARRFGRRAGSRQMG